MTGTKTLPEKDGNAAIMNEKTDGAFIRDEAATATAAEHSTTFLQGVKRHPKAIVWSAVISLSIIMDGYGAPSLSRRPCLLTDIVDRHTDTALMGSFFGFPAFQRRYGEPYETEGGEIKHTLDPKWQLALGMAAPVGNVIGVFLNGILVDRYGYKKIFCGALLALSGLVFLQFFAINIQMLLSGQLLCGIPWGIFTVLAPAYASEVVPVVLRSYVETWIVACWGLGQFISYAVLFTLNDNNTEWAYRIPFAIQWCFPVLIIPLGLFAPESPYWLVRQDRIDQAKRSLERLMGGGAAGDQMESAEHSVALIIETNRLEKAQHEGTSYLTCFQGSNLWRTEISCVAWGAQIFTGFVVQTYAAFFFQLAGLASQDAFKMTLGMGGIHLLCNLTSAAISGNYGRRAIFLAGTASMGALMVVVGGISSGDLKPQTVGFAVSAVYLIWYADLCLTLGPVPYIIIGETSNTRLKSKTIALARGTYNCLNIVNTIVAPYILSPLGANWAGKTGFLTGGLSFVMFAWGYFRLPEMRGRTFEELDILFAQPDISARDFKKAVIQRHDDGTTVDYPRKQH